MLDLIKDIMCTDTTALINGRWVPALPLNEIKKYKSLRLRIYDAIQVFRCKAVAVKWVDQKKIDCLKIDKHLLKDPFIDFKTMRYHFIKNI